jgi:hypothetical protein
LIVNKKSPTNKLTITNKNNMEIELNKVYNVIYIHKSKECIITDRIPTDKMDSTILNYYEQMRLRDRHKFSKYVDYFLKGIIKFTNEKKKQKEIEIEVFFVQRRDGSWVSVDKYNCDLSDNTKLLDSYIELEKINKLKI